MAEKSLDDLASGSGSLGLDRRRFLRNFAATVAGIGVLGNAAPAIADPTYAPTYSPPALSEASPELEERMLVTGTVTRSVLPDVVNKQTKVRFYDIDSKKLVGKAKVKRNGKNKTTYTLKAGLVPGFYERRITGKGLYEFRDIVEVVPGGDNALDVRVLGTEIDGQPFDLQRQRETSLRNEGLQGEGAAHPDGFVNWSIPEDGSPPTFYVHIPSAAKRAGMSREFFEQIIEQIVYDEFPRVHGPKWANAELVKVKRKKDLPEMGTPGTIVYGLGTPTPGASISHSEYVTNNTLVNGQFEDNVIYAGAIQIRGAGDLETISVTGLIQDSLQVGGITRAYDSATKRDSIFNKFEFVSLSTTDEDIRLGLSKEYVRPGTRVIEINGKTVFDATHLSPSRARVSNSSASGNAYQGNSNSGR